MKHDRLSWAWPVGLAIAGTAAAPSAWAQLVISDTLTGASSSYNWQALNGACLTAGDGTGSIPACVGLSYYTGKTLVGGTSGRLPDTPGQGALRLTNGDTAAGTNGNNQTGAVVSNFTFPANQGVQVTFTTVTYGGNNYNGTGADGISFYLMDGARSPGVGALGGSLGYSCSNVNGTYDGVVGAYLGVGIDEFGNFSNPGDNTDSGPGFQAGRVSLRGAGNTAWSWLNANYPTYYPSSLSSGDKADAVRATCRTGHLVNYSGGTLTDANGTSIGNKKATTEALDFNYPLIAYNDLPSGVSIANQEATNMPLRSAAVPITYNLQITQNGLLNLTYSVNGGTTRTVLSNQSITSSNGPLPSTFRFGFSSGTGGGSNVHEITCFKAAPVNLSQSSAGINGQQSSRVQSGSQVYLAFYHPTNSWGQLTAQSLIYDSTGEALSVNATANWDANCGLTGGSCAATGSSNTAQSPSNRTLLTWSGTAGIPLQWSNLSTTQKSALTAGDSSSTDARLRYLRGERSAEISTSGSGTFRVRTGVLGDIINSSPTYVGKPSSSYPATWTDLLYPSATAPEAAGPTYGAFQSANAGRTNLVYLGANDGLLHGFRTSNSSASGTNDGYELLGYMPSAVLNSIHATTASLDFSSPQYSHNYYVDATPAVGDLYYNGAWHTWLIGGTGFGGNATGATASPTATAGGSLFVLDITDPSRFSESNASALVKGDWTAATISCANVSNCGTALGSSNGTPVVRRLHNGSWAVLFGNGLNSSSGTAGLYIMLVDPTNGAITFRFIDTGWGPSNDPAGANAKNGIAYVTPADLDGDHITDYVYAGDAFGNVWRFDLTSSDPAQWSVGSAPLVSTASGLPITTKVAVGSVPGAGGTSKAGVMVAFGTGQQRPQTLTSAASYASGSHTLYGVWDWNMDGWNAIANAKAQYASLTAPQTVSASLLTAQTITATTAATSSTPATRSVSVNNVCWKGSTACTTGNTQFGWKLTLPGSQEQVIYSPTIAYGMFVVNTTIPAVNQPLSCDTQPASGYTMAVSLGTGGAARSSLFADFTSNLIGGLALSATGTPSIVTSTKRPFLVQQRVDGTPVVTRLNPAANPSNGRLTWIKLR